jgi:hypothetical protein
MAANEETLDVVLADRDESEHGLMDNICCAGVGGADPAAEVAPPPAAARPPEPARPEEPPLPLAVETQPPRPAPAGRNTLSRLDKKMLAQFRRQLATGLLLQLHSASHTTATRACVIYCSSDFRAVWWFENMLLSKRVVLEFKSITNVCTGAPLDATKSTAPRHEEVHATDVLESRQLHLVRADGSKVQLSTFSNEQRDLVLRGLRMCAVLSQSAGKDINSIAQRFGLELSNEEDDATDDNDDTNSCDSGTSSHSLVVPGSAGLGRQFSFLEHLNRHHARLYREVCALLCCEPAALKLTTHGPSVV